MKTIIPYFNKIKLEGELDYKCNEGWAKILFVHPGTEKQYNKYKELLTVNELIGVNRLFRNKKRQTEKIYGKINAKKLILYAQEIYFGEKYEIQNIEILNAPSGVTKGQPEIFIHAIKSKDSISIAHKDTKILIGYGYKCLIGVDIETLIQNRDRKYLETIFTSREIAQLEKYEQSKDLHKIITLIWSIKEAISKAYGIGLSQGFHPVEIIFNELSSKIWIISNNLYIQSKICDNTSIDILYDIDDINCKVICLVYSKEILCD